jgi:hypothetical protein
VVVEATTRRAQRKRLPSALAAIALVVGVVALGTAISLPLNQLTQPGGAVHLTDEYSPTLAAVALPDGTWLDVDASGDVTYHVFDLPWQLRLLTEASAFAAALSVAVAAFLTWQILRSRSPGRPSAASNRWRWLGVVAVLAVGALVSQRLGQLATTEIVTWTGAVLPR